MPFDPVGLWKGVPIEDLDRVELINVIKVLGAELRRQTTDRDLWMRAGDPVKYMDFRQQK